MTFRRSAPAALIAAVVIVVAGLTFMSTRLFSGLTASVEQSQFQLMQSIIDTALRDAGEEALARADIIASLPLTRQAMASKDRDKLLAEYAEMFAIQRDRRGVDQAQFHVPPAQSLLRLQAPTQFGDDLTQFRPMVVAVNREHAARKGLAIAAGGPAIFGVAPVLDAQGQHIGSFEFGLAFAPIINGLKAAYGLDLSVFIEEKPLRQYARAINPAVLSEQNRVGRFIRLYTTNGVLMRDLASDADISAATEPTRYTRDAKDVPYGVLLVPLRDGAGDPLGVIAVARDFSGSRAAAGQSLVWQICLAVFAVVLLSGVIIVVVRGFLLRPLDVLDRRFAAMAAGERTEAVEDADKFAPEIRRLAELHDRIVERERATP
ncbi:MAG: putative methyl-accepting chemotaxis protein [Reyranella sp.]|nr:putative methyl-accepting chemotaxis protein [Reyranella sp.]